MVQIPWPFTNAPGAEAQEGAGRLINVYVERRGDEQAVVWRRVPGAKTFVVDPSVGTLAGSATLLAVSNVKQFTVTMNGSSTLAAVSQSLIDRKSASTMNGSANISAATSKKIGASSTMAGASDLYGTS